MTLKLFLNFTDFFYRTEVLSIKFNGSNASDRNDNICEYKAFNELYKNYLIAIDLCFINYLNFMIRCTQCTFQRYSNNMQ